MAGSCAGVGTVVLPWGMLCHAVSCHAADACRQWAPTESPRRASVRAGYVSVVGWVWVWLCRAGVGVRLQGRVGLGSLMAPVGPGQCHGGGRRKDPRCLRWHRGCVLGGPHPPRGCVPLGDTKAGSPGGSRAGDKAELSPMLCSRGGCHQRVPGVSPCDHVPAALGHVPGVSLHVCVSAAPRTHPHSVPTWLCPWGVPTEPRTRSQGVPMAMSPGTQHTSSGCPRMAVSPGCPHGTQNISPGCPCVAVSPGCPHSTQGTYCARLSPGLCSDSGGRQRAPRAVAVPGGHSGPSSWGGHGGVPTKRPPVQRGQTHVTPQWHSSAAAGGSHGDWGHGDPPRDPRETPGTAVCGAAPSW